MPLAVLSLISTIKTPCLTILGVVMSSVLQILNQVLSHSVSSLLPVGPEEVHIQVGPMGQCAC